MAYRTRLESEIAPYTGNGGSNPLGSAIFGYVRTAFATGLENQCGPKGSPRIVTERIRQFWRRVSTFREDGL